MTTAADNEALYRAYLEGFSSVQAPADRPLELQIARALGAADHRDGHALRAFADVSTEARRRITEIRGPTIAAAPPAVRTAVATNPEKPSRGSVIAAPRTPAARAAPTPSPEVLADMNLIAAGVAAIGEAEYEAMSPVEQADFVAELFRRREIAQRQAEEE